MDALIEAATRFFLSWGVPIIMTIAYTFLAITSETTNTGKAWMSVGLGFVFVVWWVIRVLMGQAALSRAVAVGDHARVLALVDRQLKGKRGAARIPLLIYRALAHELRGDWPAALAALDEVRFDALPARRRARWKLLAANIRIAARVETGDVADARRLLDTELVPVARSLDPRLHSAAPILTNLATGRVLYAEGALPAATLSLQKVLDEIRSGNTQRAEASFYLARIAEAGGASAAPAVTRYRAEIAKLVPPDVWFGSAGQNRPLNANP